MQKRQIKIGDFKIGYEEKRVINSVLDDGQISEGKKVAEFELLFAKYVQTRFSVALNSGTSALIAGITAMAHAQNMNVSKETNVLTTPITYIATCNAIVTTGFNPVFIDVDPNKFVITPERINEKLEQIDDIEKYSLILPVHLMGFSCDMDEINKIAKHHGLQVLDDGSQAHGTFYKGRRIGSLSTLTCFSFYIAHNIQAGEMGAITTDNSEIRKLVTKIKTNGRMCDCRICIRLEGKCPKLDLDVDDEDFDPRFTHDLIGYNFKAMEFQAALGITQLHRADWIAKKRLENVKYFNEELEQFSDWLQLPIFDRRVSYMAYPLVLKNPNKISRKKIRIKLEKYGIETRPLFSCIPTQQPAFKNLKEEYRGKLPNAEYLGKQAFYIGCHQYLDRKDLDYTIDVLKKILDVKGL
jgi:CDP-6-deoxy-D-xylo-4-hexulose-3-dehydrase